MSNHEREGKGDATLDRAWRQASDEQPPPQLDAVIVAAARKGIQDRDDAVKVVRIGRRSWSWLTGWQPLAAAAGVAGLAFILVQSLPRDRDIAPSIQAEEPASGPKVARESVRSPPAPQAKEEEAAATEEPVSAEVPVDATDTEHLKQTVPSPPPAPEFVPRAGSVAGAVDQDASVDDTASMRAMEADQREATMPTMASQAASEAVAAPATERSGVAPLSASDWTARVVALYDSGDINGAAGKLRAFRVADPEADTYLPDSLRDWARTVQ